MGGDAADRLIGGRCAISGSVFWKAGYRFRWASRLHGSAQRPAGPRKAHVRTFRHLQDAHASAFRRAAGASRIRGLVRSACSPKGQRMLDCDWPLRRFLAIPGPLAAGPPVSSPLCTGGHFSTGWREGAWTRSAATAFCSQMESPGVAQMRQKQRDGPDQRFIETMNRSRMRRRPGPPAPTHGAG